MVSDFIEKGDYVLLKTPSTNLKMVLAKEQGNVMLGKFGSFPCKDLIGKPYGMVFCITKNRLEIAPLETNSDLIVETEANNQHAKDERKNQKLTQEEIEQLKLDVNSGDRSGKEAISTLLANHSKFEEKTAYSQAKYIKRKEKKFLRNVIPLKPSTYNINEFFFKKNPSKIRELRMDTLSQMLALGNVHSGGKFMVIDDTRGMVTSAILSRMNGKGFLACIHETEFPSDDIIRYFNFKKEDTDPMFTIRFDRLDQEYIPDKVIDIDLSISEPHQIARYQKKLEWRKQFLLNRQLILDGEFDGLFIASSQVHPYSIIEKVSHLLCPSRPVIVYSMYRELLLDTALQMKSNPSYLNPCLTESWLRHFQVLPGRTHPDMNTSAQSGTLLHSTTILNLGDVTPITSKVDNLKNNKKIRID